MLGRSMSVVAEEDAKGFLINVHDGIDDLRNQHSIIIITHWPCHNSSRLYALHELRYYAAHALFQAA